MIRKPFPDLSTFSNGILIILILLSFLGMTALISRSRRETTGRLLALDELMAKEAPAPSEWRRVPEALAGSHPGPAGRELDRLLEVYRTAAALLPDSRTDPGYAEAEIQVRRLLYRVSKSYTELLRQREASFDSLFYFLAVGILVQSFAFLLSLYQVRVARGELVRRDRLLTLVQKVREEERRGLASFLHDSVLQDLAGLGLRSALWDDPEGQALLAGSIDKLRRVTYGLAPLHLDQAGLAASLRELISDHLRRGGPPVDFEELGWDESRLGSESRLVLYRAVQEGLANIRKHAGAGRIELRLVGSHPFLILTLRDDGRGFDPRTARSRPAGPASPGDGGLGLALLERQVRGIGGELALESRPGAGTRLQIRYEPGKEDA
jgi:signal transduction histidine kinase